MPFLKGGGHYRNKKRSTNKVWKTEKRTRPYGTPSFCHSISKPTRIVLLGAFFLKWAHFRHPTFILIASEVYKCVKANGLLAALRSLKCDPEPFLVRVAFVPSRSKSLSMSFSGLSWYLAEYLHNTHYESFRNVPWTEYDFWFFASGECYMVLNPYYNIYCSASTCAPRQTFVWSIEEYPPCVHYRAIFGIRLTTTILCRMTYYRHFWLIHPISLQLPKFLFCPPAAFLNNLRNICITFVTRCSFEPLSVRKWRVSFDLFPNMAILSN